MRRSSRTIKKPTRYTDYECEPDSDDEEVDDEPVQKKKRSGMGVSYNTDETYSFTSPISPSITPSNMMYSSIVSQPHISTPQIQMQKQTPFYSLIGSQSQTQMIPTSMSIQTQTPYYSVIPTSTIPQSTPILQTSNLPGMYSILPQSSLPSMLMNPTGTTSISPLSFTSLVSLQTTAQMMSNNTSFMSSSDYTIPEPSIEQLTVLPTEGTELELQSETRELQSEESELKSENMLQQFQRNDHFKSESLIPSENEIQ